MISINLTTRGLATGNSISIITAGRITPITYEIIYNYFATGISFFYKSSVFPLKYLGKKIELYYASKKT